MTKQEQAVEMGLIDVQVHYYDRTVYHRVDGRVRAVCLGDLVLAEAEADANDADIDFAAITREMSATPGRAVPLYRPEVIESFQEATRDLVEEWLRAAGEHTDAEPVRAPRPVVFECAFPAAVN